MTTSPAAGSDAVLRSIQAVNDLQKTIVDSALEQDKKLLGVVVESKVRQTQDKTLGSVINELA